MDRRVQHTKKVIRDSFLKLLQKKEIKKITVSELCKIADINRATFYRYYIDVYDLLDKIEEECLKQLHKINVEYNEFTVSNYVKEYLKIFQDNKEMIKILFNTKNNIYFLSEFINEVYENCKEKWIKSNSKLKEDEIEFASVFIFNGSLGVINYWVKTDFKVDIDVVADNLQIIIKYGLEKYIYKK